MHLLVKWKWLIVGILLLLVILFAADYALRHRITNMLSDLEGFEIDQVDCSLIQNTIDLEGLEIDLQQMIGLQGEAQSIEFAGIDRMRYLKTGDVHVSEIVIKAGDLYIDLSTPTSVESQDSAMQANFHVDDFVFRDGSLHLIQDGVEVAVVEELSFRIQGAAFSADSNFLWNDYFIRTGKITCQLPENEHQMEILNASYDPEFERAEINGLRIFTEISSANWFRKVKQKQSRFDFKCPKMEIVRPNLFAWVKHQKIDIGKLVVHGGRLEVFEDKRFDHCSTCKVELPQESLLASNYGITIDSFQIKNAHLIYLSREKRKSTPGRLEFSHLYTSIYHLSNLPEVIASHSHLMIDAKAMIFESTPFDVHFDFDLKDPRGAYTFQGEVGGFELVRLNDFLSPVKQVAIGSGRSMKTTFLAKGNTISSTGNMTFAYQDLKVDFLSKNKNSKKIMSGLINEIAVKRHNVGSSKFRNGIIYFKRDQSRSIFHSMSQSLQSGIKSTVLSKHLLPPELQRKRK